MLGLEEGQVKLHSYTAEWKRLFEAEKAQLEAVIGAYILDIQHIGSTSIPGLAAKPIIDLGVGVKGFEDAAICIEPLEQLGYEYKGEMGIPGRHFICKGKPTTHHLHINEVTSLDWQQTILFRDYLLSHPDLAQEYAVLKMGLAQKFPADREAYLAGKASLIERVLQLAKAEIK